MGQLPVPHWTWAPHGEASITSYEPLAFLTPSQNWAYAVSAPIECSAPRVIKIEATVSSGSVGFGIVAPDMTTYLSGEPALEASAQRQTASVLLDAAATGHLVARNRASNEPSSCTIHNISMLPINEVRAAELKRLRAQRHGYWHYAFDLGDGVTITQTLEGGMDAHRVNQSLMLRLLSEEFGGVKDKRVLDVACSSGWHSFALAREGASVTAIDIDFAQIEQARFVQSCSTNQRERAVHFEHQDFLQFEASSPFDLIFCSGLMYHLLDPIGGARRLRALCKDGAVVHSCVAQWDGNFLELADAQKFMCCFDGEFSLVPTAHALLKIFRYAGFSTVKLLHPINDLNANESISKLLPSYRELMRHNTAYYILKP
jgi:2-polyprenyl-3-methyl-5-hydroxy-6-metoxy-1,4-benzoquinol methylase